MEDHFYKDNRAVVRSKQEKEFNVIDNMLTSRLCAQWPLTTGTLTQSLENVASVLNSRREPVRTYQSVEKMREALVRNEDLRRMIDSRLTKSMAIENLLMEDKIKNLSRFVLPESFDLGLSRYYSRVAHQVNSELRARGLQLEENPKLKQEKDRWMKRKLELKKQKQEQRERKVIRKQYMSLDVSINQAGSTLPRLKVHTPTQCYMRMNVSHKRQLKKRHQQSASIPAELFKIDDLL